MNKVAAGVFALLLVGVGCKRPVAVMHISCLGNLKQHGLALLMYTNDYDDHYPLAHNWYSGTFDYRKTNLLRCPEVMKLNKDAVGYAYDSRLHGLAMKLVKKPETQPMVFESSSVAVDTSDPFTSLPTPGRHEGKNNVGYADGHVKPVAKP